MTQNSNISLSTMKNWIDSHRSVWLEQYTTFLSFPTISSQFEQYKQAGLDCIEWLANFLKKMEFDVEYWPTSTFPTLFAQNMKAGPDKPTLLIYHHYDVQPVDPLNEWTTPPFKPTLRDGNMFARGAQDNKGQCFYTLLALQLLYDHIGSFPLNIKLCIEGEEEIGSTGLSELLIQKQKQLKADYLAIVDLGIPKPHTPAVTLGTRGLVAYDIEIQGSNTDLHSGSHGGIVLNPIHVLVNLLAGLRDDKGKITIPDFYKEVLEMPLNERTQMSLLSNPDEYQQQTGAAPKGGEIEYSFLERAWIRPTLEINGIYGGYTGEGFKTVIPAKAYAKISCRLVPDQEPEQIGELIASYLKRKAPEGAKISVHVHPGQGKAMRISSKALCVQKFAKAFEEVFEVPCTFIFAGGSIPIATQMAEICGGETILLGLGLNTDQIHAPNEHFGLDRLEKGVFIMALAMELLS